MILKLALTHVFEHLDEVLAHPDLTGVDENTVRALLHRWARDVRYAKSIDYDSAIDIPMIELTLGEAAPC